MSVLPGKIGPIGGGKLRGGILSAADVLPAGYETWKGGVGFNSSCVDTTDPRLWYCVDPTPAPDDKIADDVTASVVFEPFMVYSERDCSTWMEPSELAELARIGLDRTLSQGVALQLQTNPLATSSPSLNSEATELADSGTADIVNTLSGLVGTMVCDCAVNEITFHVPVRALPFFLEKQLLDWDASAGLYRMGPHKFSFDCYSEVGPEDVETPEDGSEIWIYATGPVEWSAGQPIEVGRPQSIIPRTNEALSLIEHLAIVRFDPCCVYAARALVS